MPGATDEDVKIRIIKARTAFLQVETIWKSRELSQRTKIRIFNLNVKSVLLYGAETSGIKSSFINSYLRRILRLHWPDKICNISLWERAQQISAEREIGRRKWRWIGHTFRKPVASTTRKALPCNSHGKGEEAGRETPGSEVSSWQTPREWASPETN